MTFVTKYTSYSTRFRLRHALSFSGSSTLRRTLSNNVSSPNQRTPLADYLVQMLEVRQAISVASYMRECLLNARHGYYTSSAHVLGARGDFVTSPEISQLFGEMLGIWLVAQWERMGAPPRVQLLELGGGRGTLMSDVLRVARRFDAFHKAIGADVHMVEASAILRQTQQSTLGCRRTPLHAQAHSSRHGVRIQWHETLSAVPRLDAVPLLLLAHEFLDCSPVHVFERHQNAWRELLVVRSSQVDGGHAHAHYPFALARAKEATLASRAFADGPNNVIGCTDHLKTGSAEKSVRGRQCEGSASEEVANTTINDVEAEENGSRQSPIDVEERATTDYGAANANDLDKHISSNTERSYLEEEGAIVEVGGDALACVQEISARIAHSGGAALLVDYGAEEPRCGGSLRAIRNHQWCHIFEAPGQCDMTADVVWSQLRRAAERVPLAHRVHCTHAISQTHLLNALGIVPRLERLLDGSNDEKVRDELVRAYERLCAPDQMGALYTAVALCDSSLPLPVAFDE